MIDISFQQEFTQSIEVAMSGSLDKQQQQHQEEDVRAACTRITGTRTRSRDLPPMSFSFSSQRGCLLDATPTPPSRRRALSNENQTCAIAIDCTLTPGIISSMDHDGIERRWAHNSCSSSSYEFDAGGADDSSSCCDRSCPATPIRKMSYLDQPSTPSSNHHSSSNTTTRKNRTAVQFLSMTRSNRLRSLSRHASIHET
jgi:hypothetical protein